MMLLFSTRASPLFSLRTHSRTRGWFAVVACTAYAICTTYAMCSMFSTSAAANTASANVAPGAPANAAVAASSSVQSDSASSTVLPPRLSRPLSGRLFYSDGQRDTLDRSRERGARLSTNANDNLDEDALLRAPLIDGVLHRANGSKVYWVNGEMRVVSANSKAPDVPNALIGPELRAQVRPVASASSETEKPSLRSNKPNAKHKAKATPGVKVEATPKADVPGAASSRTP
jgi:hypothetical protein